MPVRVEQGDCREVIPKLGVMVDAVVTDPPYHLIQVSRNGSPRQNDPAMPFGRAESRGGFMGQQWDGGDIAFRPETWATVATIMRPGAFLVAFGGPRTYHRLVSAIEDAGFVIQDRILDMIASDSRVKRLLATLSPTQADALSLMICNRPAGSLAWMFGSGFPKRRDMLKPAHEPIVLAYKPGGKRTLRVDECRIEGSGNKTFDRFAGERPRDQYRTGTTGAAIPTDLGRWPANVCHDGSEEVIEAFPQAPGALYPVKGNEPSDPTPNGIYGKFQRASSDRTGEASRERRYTEKGATDFAALPGMRRDDSGSAARFFYCAKADKQDRWGSRHPTVKPVELMKWLVALVTPLSVDGRPGLCFDPFAGSGTTGIAALATGRDCILIEREDQYIADIKERLAFYEGGGAHSVQAKNRSRSPTDVGPLFA